MSLFFETLFISNYRIRNLSLHNDRANQTIKDNFSSKSSIDLQKMIKLSKKPKRVKVIYSDKIKYVEYHLIKKRKFSSFKIVTSDIEYPYKYYDREELNKLVSTKGICDDIIIAKDGLLRDTSIANIALFDGQKWFTPKSPLLKGTIREALLKKQIILEKDVKIEELEKVKSFAIMNAIVGFRILAKPEFIFEG